MAQTAVNVKFLRCEVCKQLPKSSWYALILTHENMGSHDIRVLYKKMFKQGSWLGTGSWKHTIGTS